MLTREQMIKVKGGMQDDDCIRIDICNGGSCNIDGCNCDHSSPIGDLPGAYACTGSVIA